MTLSLSVGDTFFWSSNTYFPELYNKTVEVTSVSVADVNFDGGMAHGYTCARFIFEKSIRVGWMNIPPFDKIYHDVCKVINFSHFKLKDEDSNNDLTIDDPWFEPTQFELPLEWATKRHRCIKGGTPIDFKFVCRECGKDMGDVF